MERVIARKPAFTLDTLRAQLQIDKDDLDTCLVEQPDLYYHVAEAYVMAVAKRDEAKLNMEQVTAELDKQFRQAAAEAEEKLTEAALSRKLTASPRMQTLEKDYLLYRVEADKWQALKEAFQQRSFMLRELVAVYVRRMGDLSLDREVKGTRQTLVDAQADKNHEAASRARRERFGR
jgi:hypothetical protein